MPETPATAPFAEDNLTGDWKGAAGPIPVVFKLKLGADNKVSGTIESNQGNGTLSGTYDPAAGTLTLTLVIDTGPTVTITAKISGNSMTGTAEFSGMKLPVTATRIGAPQAANPAAPKPGGSAAVATPVKVSIDFDGFEQRVLRLPVSPGRFDNLAVNDRNQLLYARIGGGETGIKLFDITGENPQEKTVAAGASAFDITADGKKLLVVRGRSATIQDASPGASSEPDRWRHHHGADLRLL